MRSRARAVVSIGFLGVAMLATGVGRAAAADRPVEKIPANLKDWQFSLYLSGAHERGGPIRVFHNGSYECGRRLLESTWSEPLAKGNLPEADRAAALTMARVVASQSAFNRSGGTTWDIPNYKFQFSSGSRVIRVQMDLDRPALLGIRGIVNAGVVALNRAIRTQKGTREFLPPDTDEPRPAMPPPGEIVPMNPDWLEVQITFITADEDITVSVENPGKKDTMSGFGISRSTGKDRKYWKPPQPYPVSDDERRIMLGVVRNIVNKFAFSNDDVVAEKALPRCRVGITDEGKVYSVEFPIDERVPMEWISQIHQVSVLAHKKEKALPVFGEWPVKPETQ